MILLICQIMIHRSSLLLQWNIIFTTRCTSWHINSITRNNANDTGWYNILSLKNIHQSFFFSRRRYDNILLIIFVVFIIVIFFCICHRHLLLGYLLYCHHTYGYYYHYSWRTRYHYNSQLHNYHHTWLSMTKEYIMFRTVVLVIFRWDQFLY